MLLHVISGENFYGLPASSFVDIDLSRSQLENSGFLGLFAGITAQSLISLIAKSSATSATASKIVNKITGKEINKKSKKSETKKKSGGVLFLTGVENVEIQFLLLLMFNVH